MLGQKLLAFPELKAAKGIHLSRRHIDRMEANGDFPVRVKRHHVRSKRLGFRRRRRC
jgi:hypothetical protein